MTIHTLFSAPQEIIGKQWREDQSPAQARTLALARDALLFLSATGQQYRFEDFCGSLEPRAHPPASQEQLQADLDQIQEGLHKTEAFFTKLRDEAKSARERELIQVILDALLFISSTQQHRAFGEYLEHVEAAAPPYAIAAFDTKEEAEAWLRKHPTPPHSANVLIDNTYHDVLYDRETNTRCLPRNRDLEYYLAGLKHTAPPVAAASFANLKEAEDWLRAQPASFRRAWVSIAGALYLAAYYPNLAHRALFPLSMAKGYEEENDKP